MQADMVNDGKQACEAVISRLEGNLPTYDLIMLDFAMPVMDGPTAANSIIEAVELY